MFGRKRKLNCGVSKVTEQSKSTSAISNSKNKFVNIVFFNELRKKIKNKISDNLSIGPPLKRVFQESKNVQ